MKSATAITQQVGRVEVTATPEVLRAFANAHSNSLLSDLPTFHRTHSIVRALNMQAVRVILKGAQRQAETSRY
jgi:hypothetical protein